MQAVQDFPLDEVIRREFEHALDRQHGPMFPKNKAGRDAFLDKFVVLLNGYLATLTEHGFRTTDDRVQALIGLCQTVAFAHRTRDDSGADGPSAPSSSQETDPVEKQTQT